MAEFTFSGAILAGGRSSRMGRDKAFLTLDGRTLVSRQAALLNELGCAELLLSGRPDTDYGVPSARMVYDSVADSGPLAGLAAVLAAARHPWVLVLAVDLPHITRPFLQSLLDQGAGRTGIAPRITEGWEPLAALYPRTLLPEAEAALRDGRYSLQPFLDQAEHSGFMCRRFVASDEQPLLANWNSPSDFAKRP
ncbi:MAG TPA: molybdenum cofactor guanylyltransferase [Rariglobus sp.]|jgi:molybdopterin-guanine dinucleotide biosynthesis protein A|nr:molybdenum cofactor guanylyltransferase [Rariglobus sp.]